jgi:hypothetical protein
MVIDEKELSGYRTNRKWPYPLRGTIHTLFASLFKLSRYFRFASRLHSTQLRWPLRQGARPHLQRCGTG